MLTRVLVDELALLCLDIALLARVELAALLNDLLRKIFGITPQAFDTLGHHKYLFNRVSLLPVLTLLKQSQRVFKTRSVLVNWNVTIKREHDQ